MAQAAARRAAERAARDRLAGPLIGAVGELGVAVAVRESAVADVPVVEGRARDHVRRAQAEADQMVTDARAQVATADDGYRAAHQAAVDAGWSVAALTDMGYPLPDRPASTRSRRKRAAASRSASVRELPTAENRSGMSTTASDADVDADAATTVG
jgi:hypothetical protein